MTTYQTKGWRNHNSYVDAFLRFKILADIITVVCNYLAKFTVGLF